MSKTKKSETKRSRRTTVANLVLLALVAASVGVVLYVRQGPSASSAESKADDGDFSPEESRRLYAKLDHIIAAARKAAQGEPEAETLVENFASDVAVGKFTSYGQIRFISRYSIKKDTSSFMLFISNAERKLVPRPLYATFEFDQSINAVLCTFTDPISEGVLGAAFIHELVHWREFLARDRKPKTERFADHRELKGEMLAYNLEFRVMNRYTSGAFNRVINEVIYDNTLSVTAAGHREPTKAGWQRLLSAWSDLPLSEAEFWTRKNEVWLAFLFAQVSSEEKKLNIYAQFRGMFERNHKPLTE